MRVLVTGAGGLLGCALAPVLAQAGHEVIAHGRAPGSQARADLTDIGQTFGVLDRFRPDVIVNLAALANVDACEEHPQLAYEGNVRSVENLVAWIRRNGSECHLVHISTDHVYDGAGPHCEERVTLTNYYAFSKYAGELAAAVIPATVLRINFFGRSYSPGRSTFSDWLVRVLRTGEPISAFDDVFFSPLSMATLTRLIEVVVRQRQAGVFNVGSVEGISKADFAFALAAVLKLPTGGITRTHIESARLRAYRPRDMRMDSAKFMKTFGVSLPSLTEEIESMRSCYDDAM